MSATATPPVTNEPRSLLRRRREPSPFNLPNFLTATRFLLAIVMFWLISQVRGAETSYYFLYAGIVFAIACATDWFDGWAARRLGIVSSFGRSFDPLVDKLLICGAYICLIPFGARWTGLHPWMVVLIVTRELLVTSLRGYIESLGVAFGADLGGKIKMFLQCITLGMILLCLYNGRFDQWMTTPQEMMEHIRDFLIVVMLAATGISGLLYIRSSERLFLKYQQEQDRKLAALEQGPCS